ncbi:MAG: hypothetical protein DRP55_08855 [Spirochaetes bacterium]|nr:MAG: hypothetical protein DRP55_08855 [Spirochaetota bacterium]
MSIKKSQEYMILGLLFNGPMYGYEVHHYFKTKLDRLLYTGISQVYALLKGLEKKDMVRCKTEIQENRPPKKIYSITPHGKNSLIKWLRTPVKNIRDLRVEFLSKLFLIKETKIYKVYELVDQEIELLEKKSDKIKKVEIASKNDFEHLVLKFRLSQIDAAINWLKESEKYLKGVSQ